MTEISTELGMAPPISLSWLSDIIRLVSKMHRLSTIFKNLFIIEVPSSMLTSWFFLWSTGLGGKCFLLWTPVPFKRNDNHMDIIQVECEPHT